MRTVGRHFTWSNYQTFSKIDRIFVNAIWIQQWPHLEGTILEAHFSDHCPLSVMFESSPEGGWTHLNFYRYKAGQQNHFHIVNEY
uniref:Putative ovule protein n=1 Tax=Solanum chacoense TaxID=4108 RepID=A0A0V0GZJ9_SOLCH